MKIECRNIYVCFPDAPDYPSCEATRELLDIKSCVKGYENEEELFKKCDKFYNIDIILNKLEDSGKKKFLYHCIKNGFLVGSER
jgi:hypothetical protein